jgi:hypothetical protein
MGGQNTGFDLISELTDYDKMTRALNDDYGH